MTFQLTIFLSCLKAGARVTYALFVTIVLTGCYSDSARDPSGDFHSRIELSQPEKLRTAFNIQYSNIYAEVIINNGEKQIFNFNSNDSQVATVTGIILDTDNTILIVWYEIFEGSPLELARQQGLFFADSQAGSVSIDFPYDYDADDNQNGTNNFTERDNGTCPRFSCSDNNSENNQNLINARTNILGSWSLRYVATQCLEEYTFSSDGSFSQTSLDEILSGSYTIYPFESDIEKLVLTLTPTQDNLGVNCLGDNDDSTERIYTFIIAFPSMDIMTWSQTSNPDFVVSGLNRTPNLNFDSH